ncbi:MAG TPA: gamma-glutamyl-gamma-aminobutyrate hydrolase family protein [Nitrososphaerales archaeon]|nr:gamma-glutamyl-gamma-aminobutyrate hydrolase family protein [Nitrososphaerales archaeon]
MVRVLVVNNYPSRERVVTLERCLEENGAHVVPVELESVSASRFDSSDGVVLSGSPAMFTEARTISKFQPEVDAVLDSNVPVLGVCFGHQLLAHAFGAEVVRDSMHVLEMVKTTVLKDDTLFDGLPRSLMLMESRYEIVKSLPDGFALLARSSTSRIATMKHPTRQLYGVQFHPERFTREHPEGERVVGNFVRMLR